MKRKTIVVLLLMNVLMGFNVLLAQNVILEGYVFEDNNRGFLNEVRVEITDKSQTNTFCEVVSNREGFFTCDLPVGQDFLISVSKDVFKDTLTTVSSVGKKGGDKIYSKIKMLRSPGYLFDVTLAEKLLEGQNEVDAIQGALIEIYNNTTQKEALVLKEHPNPTFQYTLLKGNHYTIMIRKEGFFTKRIEAYVDIDGCILCMDGVSEMSPGVSDNLTAGNELGTLLANIELERAELNKAIEIENIYYDYNSSRIKSEAKLELDKLIFLLKNNPSIIVELGSHTDARGKNEYNEKLSQERAESAVSYIVEVGEIDVKRILAKGYGETQLVNQCKDGVNCSDADHQKNRRTELKIIGYQEQDAEQKSLERIIEEERFELMLLELQNQQEYKVEEGVVLPESLKKQLEEEPASVRPVVEEEPVKIKEPIKEIVETVQKPIEEKVKVVVEQKEEVRTEFKREEDLFPPVEVAEITEESGGIFSDTKINVNTENNARAVSPMYDGFKVEIVKSEVPLKDDHEIFFQHGNIFLDVVSDTNFSYMLGDYSLFEQADNFMRQFLLLKYPSAKVVQYKKGKRLDF